MKDEFIRDAFQKLVASGLVKNNKIKINIIVLKKVIDNILIT